MSFSSPSRRPELQAPALRRPYQRTRFQRWVAEAGALLQRWAANPWRRLSLLLITLLLMFCLGSGIGVLVGVLVAPDQLAALVCVLALEAAVRLRRPLLQRGGDRLWLQLLDMTRLGLLYGLLLEGFKLL